VFAPAPQQRQCVELEDSKSSVQTECVDDDLAHAVDSLFLESTSDLLFTSTSSGQDFHRSMPDYLATKSLRRSTMSY